jgi:hypothetical protein
MFSMRLACLRACRYCSLWVIQYGSDACKVMNLIQSKMKRFNIKHLLIRLFFLITALSVGAGSLMGIKYSFMLKEIGGMAICSLILCFCVYLSYVSVVAHVNEDI